LLAGVELAGGEAIGTFGGHGGLFLYLLVVALVSARL
jgi:hypothetical protein